MNYYSEQKLLSLLMVHQKLQRVYKNIKWISNISALLEDVLLWSSQFQLGPLHLSLSLEITMKYHKTEFEVFCLNINFCFKIASEQMFWKLLVITS